MERIAMSQDERDDLHWLKRVEAGSMTECEAAEKMGVRARWVRKLVQRMKKEGDAVVVHGLRGRASNRKLSDKIQRQALTILKTGLARFRADRRGGTVGQTAPGSGGGPSSGCSLVSGSTGR